MQSNGTVIKPGRSFEPGFYFRHLQKNAEQIRSIDIMYDLEKASQIAYIQTAVILQQNISGDTSEYLMLILSLLNHYRRRRKGRV